MEFYGIMTIYAGKQNRNYVLLFLAAETICWASCSAVSSIWMPPCPLIASITALQPEEETENENKLCKSQIAPKSMGKFRNPFSSTW